MSKSFDFVVTARCFVCRTRFEFYPTDGQDSIICECGRVVITTMRRPAHDKMDAETCPKNLEDLDMEPLSLGIAKTQACLVNLTGAVCDAIEIFRGGISLGDIGSLISCGRQINDMVQDAKAVLPELADLSAEEAAVLGAASFASVKKIIEKVASLRK